jgi:hypothetical protein
MGARAARGKRKLRVATTLVGGDVADADVACRRMRVTRTVATWKPRRAIMTHLFALCTQFARESGDLRNCAHLLHRKAEGGMGEERGADSARNAFADDAAACCYRRTSSSS